MNILGTYWPVCSVCGGVTSCDLNVGDRVRITAWGTLNGTPPRLDALPKQVPGRIVKAEGPEKDAFGDLLPGECSYQVEFPHYGVLLVKGQEMMHDDRE